MATVSWATSRSTNWSFLSWKPSALPKFPSRSPWTPGECRAFVYRAQSSFFGGWDERQENYTLRYFLKVEQRPLLPWLCFEPRISEIENLKTNGVITIENLLFYKAHAYDLLCWVGFLPFPWTVLCFSSYGNSKQFAHLLLWSWDSFHIDDLASNVTLLTDRLFFFFL